MKKNLKKQYNFDPKKIAGKDELYEFEVKHFSIIHFHLANNFMARNNVLEIFGINNKTMKSSSKAAA